MTTLQDTFGLVLGDYVIATVRASNEKGDGQFSGMNSDGAKIQIKPSTPEQAPARGPSTDQNRIEVSWGAFITYIQRGGALIESYEL
jgi:hypothetical protein